MKRDDLDALVRKYLACKKLSADDEVKARREYARRERARWHEIFAFGCNDPAWPDGCNLNLVRNHIIAELTGLENLGVDVSDEWVPPKVNNGLMIPTGKWFKVRCNRFKQTGQHVQIASEEISLF